MSAPHIPTTFPVQLGKDLLSAEACEILQQGIRAALIEEAMRWTGDARVEVWMALISAGQIMGIEISKDKLYREQIELRGARSAPPQTNGPAFLWNGRRPTYALTLPDKEPGHGPV